VGSARVLIENISLNVNLTDTRGRSPLYYAVANGHIEIAALIVSHKSWKCPQDPSDPSHLDRLSTIKPAQHVEEMKVFLEGLPRNG